MRKLKCECRWLWPFGKKDSERAGSEWLVVCSNLWYDECVIHQQSANACCPRSSHPLSHTRQLTFTLDRLLRLPLLLRLRHASGRARLVVSWCASSPSPPHL